MFIRVIDKEGVHVVINTKDINTAYVSIDEASKYSDCIDIKVKITTPFGEFETEGIYGIEIPEPLYDNAIARKDISALYACALAHTLNTLEEGDILAESALDTKVDDVLCNIAEKLISKLGY